jgi:hypothetical protein
MDRQLADHRSRVAEHWGQLGRGSSEERRAWRRRDGVLQAESRRLGLDPLNPHFPTERERRQFQRAMLAMRGRRPAPAVRPNARRSALAPRSRPRASRARRRAPPDREEPEPPSFGACWTGAALDVEHLGRFLRTVLVLLELTDLERESWVDAHIIGIQQREIARRDGVSEACVTQRLARAQRKIDNYVDQAVAA